MLGCSSDIDFLAKLHCVRQALDKLMLSEDNRQYTINAGRDMIVSLLNTSNMVCLWQLCVFFFFGILVYNLFPLLHILLTRTLNHLLVGMMTFWNSYRIQKT